MPDVSDHVRALEALGWTCVAPGAAGARVMPAKAPEAAENRHFEARGTDAQPLGNPGWVPPAERREVRYVPAKGETIAEMREHVLTTGLYAHGDVALVWVNQGDLWPLTPGYPTDVSPVAPVSQQPGTPGLLGAHVQVISIPHGPLTELSMRAVQDRDTPPAEEPIPEPQVGQVWRCQLLPFPVSVISTGAQSVRLNCLGSSVAQSRSDFLAWARRTGARPVRSAER